ncbi:MAG: hypothetical protein PVI75_05415 [Gammaproteobacteria bacterium]|jgi:serine/threonine protein phosphatase PrpC
MFTDHNLIREIKSLEKKFRDCKYRPCLGRINNCRSLSQKKYILKGSDIVYVANDGHGYFSRYGRYKISQQDTFGCCSFDKEFKQDTNIKDLEQVVRSTINKTGKGCENFRDNASTLTLAMFYQQKLVIGQCGDSSALLITKNNEKCKVTLLTPSHNVSYINEEERTRIKKAGGKIGPHNINMPEGSGLYLNDGQRYKDGEYKGILKNRSIAYSRGLGGRDHRGNGYTYKPDIISIDLLKEKVAILVLCTDGAIPDGAHIGVIENFLNNGGKIAHLPGFLCRQAQVNWPEDAKPDNMTCMVTTLKAPGKKIRNKNLFVADGSGDKNNQGEFTSHYIRENLFNNFTQVTNIKVELGVSVKDIHKQLVKQLQELNNTNDDSSITSIVDTLGKINPKAPEFIKIKSEVDKFLSKNKNSFNSSDAKNCDIELKKYLNEYREKYSGLSKELFNKITSPHKNLPSESQDLNIRKKIVDIQKRAKKTKEATMPIYKKYVQMMQLNHYISCVYELCTLGEIDYFTAFYGDYKINTKDIGLVLLKNKNKTWEEKHQLITQNQNILNKLLKGLQTFVQKLFLGSLEKKDMSYVAIARYIRSQTAKIVNSKDVKNTHNKCAKIDILYRETMDIYSIYRFLIYSKSFSDQTIENVKKAVYQICLIHDDDVETNDQERAKFLKKSRSLINKSNIKICKDCNAIEKDISRLYQYICNQPYKKQYQNYFEKLASVEIDDVSQLINIHNKNVNIKNRLLANQNEYLKILGKMLSQVCEDLSLEIEFYSLVEFYWKKKIANNKSVDSLISIHKQLVTLQSFALIKGDIEFSANNMENIEKALKTSKPKVAKDIKEIVKKMQMIISKFKPQKNPLSQSQEQLSQLSKLWEQYKELKFQIPLSVLINLDCHNNERCYKM